MEILWKISDLGFEFQKKSLQGQEVGNEFHVPIRLFYESGMAGIIEGNPFDFLDFVEERLNNEVLGDIFTTIGDECGDTNEVQTIDDRPIPQDARKREKIDIFDRKTRS